MKWEKFLSRKFLALVLVLVIIGIMLATGKSVDDVKQVLDALWPVVGVYIGGNALSKIAEKKAGDAS